MDAKERAEYEQYLKGLHDQASAYESTYVVGKIDGLKEGIEQGVKQGIEQELEQGVKQGIEQGKNEEKIKIAKNLLDILDNKTIALKIGLDEDFIESLRAKI